MATTKTTRQRMSLPRAYRLLDKVGRFKARKPTRNETDELPLIPHREDKKGRTKALDGSQYDRKIPYNLRGRRDEFNFLARRLVSEPGPIALVTGPPGSGKSALTRTVAAYATSIGHTVVKLDPRHLASAANIAHACRDAVMSPQDAPAYATHRTNVQVNAQIRAAAELVFAKTGAQLGGSLEQESTRHIAGDINLIEHLKATCQYQGRTHPLLIIVDEVQKIESTLQTGAEARESIENSLKNLNDDAPDENLPIMTILAGLDPVRDTMHTLVNRPASGSDLQLTPIATEHIKAILDDYLNIQIPRRISKGFFTESELQEWAESCEGHVLFANQLGYILQSFALGKLQQGVKQYVRKDHYNDIEKSRKNQRKEYYIRQLPDLATQSRTFDVAVHIAQASRINRDPDNPHITGPITWHCAYDLAEQALVSNPRKTKAHIADELQSIMHTLQHKGIFCRMQPLSQFLRLNKEVLPEPTEYCAIPIPTITTKLEEYYCKLEGKELNRIDRNVQKTLRKHPYNPATRWTWDHVPQRRPIPSLKVPYEEPIPADTSTEDPVQD